MSRRGRGRRGGGAYSSPLQPIPTISAISPAVFWRRSAGTPVTITGTGFTASTAVTIGGLACTSVVRVNGTTITCNTPALAADGSFDVRVTNLARPPATLTSGYSAFASRAWFVADAANIHITAGLVDTWNDISGNGFNAAEISAHQPAVAAAVINGLDAVDFAPDKFLTNGANSLVTAGSAFSVMSVARHGNGALLTIRDTSKYAASIFFTTLGIFYVHGNGADVTSNITTADYSSETNSTTWFDSIHAYQGSGNNPNVYLNGTLRAITSVGSSQGVEDGVTGFQLGAANSGQNWGAQIREIIVLDHISTAAERTAWQAYITALYGL